MIVWREAMSVGSRDIDDDHRELIDIINEFQLSPSMARARISAQKLLQYTKEHFAKEEKIQRACGLKNAEWHRGEHEKILVKLTEQVETLSAPGAPDPAEIIADMSKLMRDWIIGHVIKIDCQMKPYIAANREAPSGKTAPAKAPPPTAVKTSPSVQAVAGDHMQFHYDTVQALVVDDEAFSRRIVLRMLKTIGVTDIREAADGGAALEAFQTKTSNLIICDLEMTPMDGIAFVRNLRAYEKEQARAAVPVIFLTSHTDSCNVRQARELGAVGYLVKPVTAKELKRRLDVVLSAKELLLEGV